MSICKFNGMKKGELLMLAVNVAIVAAIFVLNGVYQYNGFDFTLKCVCSGGFALLGVANLAYALATGASNRRIYIAMATGLLLAMLGDVLIGYDFIIGAASFALGHVCFVVAYCFERRMTLSDLAISAVIFICAAAFLIFSPLLTFDEPIFRGVCIVYAFIISLMLGKAIANLHTGRGMILGVIAIASALFFFSDLMLVFDWFIGRWNWTDNACMSTYYPALCMLAFSMIMRITSEKGSDRVLNASGSLVS